MSRRLGLGLTLWLLIAAPGWGEDANPRWDFLRTNLQIFPGTEKIFEPDADLFWRLKADLSNVRASEKLPEGEYPFEVSTGGEGRRRTPEAPEGAESVLFLGDSCTFGIPVNDGEAFPAQVGATLGIRATNAGVPGYSAFQGRVLLEKWPTGPKAVVITFWVNGRTSWDHLSDTEHQELLAAERAGEMSRHRVTRLLRRVTPGIRPRLTEEEFAGELRKMIDRSREMGAEPLLVVWPSRPQMSGADEDTRQGIIRTVGAEAHVTVVELADRFRVAGGAKLFVDPVHATVEGYRIAAEAVAEAVRPLLGTK